MVEVHSPPGFFSLEEAQSDLGTDVPQALAVSVHGAFAEWLLTPIPKGLTTSMKTLGCWMADDVSGQLGRYHSAAVPDLRYGTSKDGQFFIVAGNGQYALRTKKAVADDLRVRDTGTVANAEYNEQKPLVDVSGNPIPPRHLNLVYRLDETETKVLGVYLTFGQVGKPPIWIWQLDGLAIQPYPVYQAWFDHVTGVQSRYTTYCPPGLRLTS